MSAVDFPLIFDGHNDTVLRHHVAATFGEADDFFAENEGGHIDLPRARKGGLGGGFFAIFVPNEVKPPQKRDAFPGEKQEEDEGPANLPVPAAGAAGRKLCPAPHHGDGGAPGHQWEATSDGQVTDRHHGCGTIGLPRATAPSP